MSASVQNVDKLNGVFINNSCIRFSDCVKLLGVHIDCFLSFDYHISSLVSNCMFHLKNIAKIKRFLTKGETEKLIHAFITSKFDYCNVLLYGVKSTSLSKLQAVQNKAARTLLSLPSHEPVTDDTFNQLHWLKLEKRIIFKILLFVHKLFINAAPSGLSVNW